MTNNICIIPAKGNSRRLKKKNLSLVGGIPLVVRAIKSAFESKCFKEIYVSSNDNQILKLAMENGARIFKRKKELCGDKITAKDVVWRHIKELGKKFDYIGMLLPTNPLRESKHIFEAYNLLVTKKANTLVSICNYEEKLNVALKISKNKIQPFFGEKEKSFFIKKNAYRFNGAIYLAKYDFFLKKKVFFEKNTVPYIMKRKHSFDVNTREELEIADVLASNFKIPRYNEKN